MCVSRSRVRGLSAVSLVVLAGLAASPTWGRGADGAIVDARPGFLGLRQGQIDVATRTNELAQPGAFSVARRHVVMLDGPMSPARGAALQAAGVVVGEYLPTNAFLCDLSGADKAAVGALGFVTWVGAYDPAWKIDPQIGRRDFATPERRALAAAGRAWVTAYLFVGEELAPALLDLRAIPSARVAAVDDMGDQYMIDIEIPLADVGLLAGVASIQFVEEYPELTLRNNTNRWIVQSNVSGFFPFYDKGIHGEGQILGHMDGQVGEAHCSFDDTDPVGPLHRKIVYYGEALGYDFHGTHTAGTAVGDSGSNNDARGVAYMARMAHNLIPSFSDTAMYNRLNTHYSNGATMHTNSWGNDGTVAYDGLARGIDRFSYDFQDNLVFFAVTNLSTLKNPENAKNCVAVGASQDTPNQHLHCSGGAGPTNDGRRKPEVYAPGCSTRSSTGSTGCTTATATGTSMACPAVTGAALLVRQYYTDGFYPSGDANPSDAFTPSGALVKATLINASVDMTGISGYPSNTEGWGRLLADHACFFNRVPEDTRRMIVRDVRNGTGDALTTGGSYSQEFEVDSSAEQLRVTLVWTEPPAAVNANPAYINDLNLVVERPDGTSYRGNVFSGGSSTTGGTHDFRNNVEQVHVNSPPTGTWTVTVNAQAVNSGIQGYAIVITGAVSEQTPCPADFNGDGTVNSLDVLDFLTAFNDQDPSADMNADGEFNTLDVLLFLNIFNTPC